MTISQIALTFQPLVIASILSFTYSLIPEVKASLDFDKIKTARKARKVKTAQKERKNS